MLIYIALIRAARSGQRFVQLFAFNYKLINIFISTGTYSNPVMEKVLVAIPLQILVFSLMYNLSTRLLQGHYSDVTGSHKKLFDCSLHVCVLCYYAASLVSLVGVLLIWNAFNQRIIWKQLLNKRNRLCTVCSQLLLRGKKETNVSSTKQIVFSQL